MNRSYFKSADIIVFLLIGALVSFWIFWTDHKQIQLKKQTISDQISTQFRAVLFNEQKVAERFYDDHAHHIATLLKDVKQASELQKQKIRERLLDEYQSYYENAKNQGLGVLHIFDHEGASFLRFHRPGKHGDPLTGVRHSLNELVYAQRYTQGLEIGRFREAYRFVFPLFYNGEFIAGIEFSIDFKDLAQQLSELLGGIHQQFLLTEQLQKHLFKDQFELYYQPSELHQDFAIAQKFATAAKQYQPYLKQIHQSPDFADKLKQQQAFTVLFNQDGQDKSAHFLPLLSSDKTFSGYLFSLATLSNNPISQLHRQSWSNLALFWLLWIALFVFWRRNIRSQGFAKHLLDSQPNFFALSRNNNLLYANKALLDFLNFNDFQQFHKKYSCLNELFIEDGKQTDLSSQDWTSFVLKHPNQEHKIRLKNTRTNKTHILNVKIQPFKMDSKLYLITLHDMTEVDQERIQLEHENQHDPLTGVFNRRGFDTLFEQYSRDENSVLSLIIFDIDHFKKINDSYGHDVGDIILKELTALISLNLRSTDDVIRWGGEEFMVLLNNTNIEQATLIANHLRKQISQNPFTQTGELTCSFGVSHLMKSDTQTSLVKRCDKALYLAKEAGRNRVVNL